MLKDLLDRPGVSGFEEQRRKRIVEYFSKFCDSVSTDVIGNIIGTIGRGERPIMLAGHYDQIGFMISYIDDDGYLCFKQVGTWDNFHSRPIENRPKERIGVYGRYEEA